MIDMCGIAGIYSFKGNAKPEHIKRMADSLRHRGPDDEGFLAVNSESTKAYPLTGSESKVQGPRIEDFNEPANLFLGHRRLSIIDLSPAGHQPMCNEDGSLWIVYNGEIYNYLELRKELEPLGHRLKSQTDTEVVLHAYEEWGTDCLRRFNGMWAFAVVDLKSNKIFCARDRAGVKPFYYFYDGKRFCFASEIKALIEIDGFSIEPNEQILADYLFSGLLDHTEETFFKNIYQLRPGEYLLIESNKLTVRSYWDIDPKGVRFCSESDDTEQFYELLQDSVRLRLRSDVPIGTCLSGGLDSSTIVCLANRLMFDAHAIDPRLVGERQKTFSSCFENHVYDERKYIELVIKQTNAEKNYVFPKGESLCKDLPRLVWHQDEPFGSTSIYAQWNVMKLAKEQGVKVLLDGQGGDELLAGYLPSFYFLFRRALKQVDLGRFIKEIKGFRKNHGNMLSQFLPGMLITIVPSWGKPLFQKFVKRDVGWAEGGFQKKYFRNFPRPMKFNDDLNDYLYHNFRSMTLPGLLHYEDRNSTAFSLEARLPFLDYRLVEFIFSLPSEQKIKGGVTKVILRNAMQSILPEEVKNRRDKMGFVTPGDIWVRTILRNQIYDIISSKSFAERGYFNIDKVKKVFDKHCKREINVSSLIWRWVNLELWFRTFFDGRPIPEVWEGHGNPD
jgi:asparagine synthase (glutamine-hydrolysing)